jgi:hypothetical protein
MSFVMRCLILASITAAQCSADLIPTLSAAGIINETVAGVLGYCVNSLSTTTQDTIAAGCSGPVGDPGGVWSGLGAASASAQLKPFSISLSAYADLLMHINAPGPVTAYSSVSGTSEIQDILINPSNVPYTVVMTFVMDGIVSPLSWGVLDLNWGSGCGVIQMGPTLSPYGLPAQTCSSSLTIPAHGHGDLQVSLTATSQFQLIGFEGDQRSDC